jgi:hypothetical protein
MLQAPLGDHAPIGSLPRHGFQTLPRDSADFSPTKSATPSEFVNSIPILPFYFK